jgi:hypothetical protein
MMAEIWLRSTRSKQALKCGSESSPMARPASESPTSPITSKSARRAIAAVLQRDYDFVGSNDLRRLPPLLFKGRSPLPALGIAAEFGGSGPLLVVASSVPHSRRNRQGRPHRLVATAWCGRSRPPMDYSLRAASFVDERWQLS